MMCLVREVNVVMRMKLMVAILVMVLMKVLCLLEGRPAGERTTPGVQLLYDPPPSLHFGVAVMEVTVMAAVVKVTMAVSGGILGRRNRGAAAGLWTKHLSTTMQSHVAAGNYGGMGCGLCHMASCCSSRSRAPRPEPSGRALGHTGSEGCGPLVGRCL